MRKNLRSVNDNRASGNSTTWNSGRSSLRPLCSLVGRVLKHSLALAINFTRFSLRARLRADASRSMNAMTFSGSFWIDVVVFIFHLFSVSASSIRVSYRYKDDGCRSPSLNRCNLLPRRVKKYKEDNRQFLNIVIASIAADPKFGAKKSSHLKRLSI